MKLLIDTQGGDKAPIAMLNAVQMAKKENNSLDFVLFGDKKDIEEVLGADAKNYEIVQTEDIITNEDEAALSIRKKDKASIVLASKYLVEHEDADAFISAGSTGALLAAAMLIVKRIDGFKRASIPTFLPGLNGPTLLLDSGANVDCEPEFIYEFAKLGSKYVEKLLGIQNPKVALVSNGAEAKKGNELTKKAHEILKNSELNFIGNIEANEILTTEADIIVQDGFVGNVILKELEGMSKVFVGNVKNFIMQDNKYFSSDEMKMSFMKDLMSLMGLTKYGGSPVLGVNKAIIKAHGNSDEKAFYLAIKNTVDFVNSGVIEYLKEN